MTAARFASVIGTLVSEPQGEAPTHRSALNRLRGVAEIELSDAVSDSPKCEHFVHRLGYVLRNFRVFVAIGDSEPLGKHMCVLVQRRLETAVERILEHALPVMLVRRTDEAHNL